MLSSDVSNGCTGGYSSGGPRGSNHWLGLDVLETQEGSKEKLNTSEVSLQHVVVNLPLLVLKAIDRWLNHLHGSDRQDGFY